MSPAVEVMPVPAVTVVAAETLVLELMNPVPIVVILPEAVIAPVLPMVPVEVILPILTRLPLASMRFVPAVWIAVVALTFTPWTLAALVILPMELTAPPLVTLKFWAAVVDLNTESDICVA